MKGFPRLDVKQVLFRLLDLANGKMVRWTLNIFNKGNMWYGNDPQKCLV